MLLLLLQLVKSLALKTGKKSVGVRGPAETDPVYRSYTLKSVYGSRVELMYL